MKYQRFYSLIVLALVVLAVSACGSSNLQPTAAPQNIPTNAPPTSAPATNPTTAPVPTSAPAASGASGPAWWPAQLAMPPGTTFNKELGKQATGWRTVSWTAPDPNVDGIRDFIFKEAGTAGYKTFISPQGQVKGKLYTLFVWNSSAGYKIELAASSDQKSAKVIGTVMGVLHIKTSGAAGIDLDLPVTTYSFNPQDLAKSVALSAEAANPQCDQCVYVLGFDGSGYKGPATYTIWKDVRVDPGGVDDLVETYRGAKSCTIVVKDQFSGTIDCKGLHPENDLKKTLDVSGAWQIASQG